MVFLKVGFVKYCKMFISMAFQNQGTQWDERSCFDGYMEYVPCSTRLFDRKSQAVQKIESKVTTFVTNSWALGKLVFAKMMDPW